MSNPWCVAPEAVRKELAWTDPQGVERTFWVQIKKFLNVGEERRVQTAGWKGVSGVSATDDQSGAEIRIDWKATSFARAEAYLIDWSLEDEKGRRLQVNRNSLEALHPEVFELIEGAITAHVKQMDEEKKARRSNSAPIPTSA